MGPRRRPSAPELKAQRRLERKGSGKPSDFVVRPSTVRRYEAACSFLFQWCRRNRHVVPIYVALFDSLLCLFVDDCYAEGEAKALVADVLSGLQHFCPLYQDECVLVHAAWEGTIAQIPTSSVQKLVRFLAFNKSVTYSEKTKL